MGACGMTHDPVLETPLGFGSWSSSCSRFSPHSLQSPMAPDMLHLDASLQERLRDEEVTMAPIGDVSHLSRGLNKVQETARGATPPAISAESPACPPSLYHPPSLAPTRPAPAAKPGNVWPTLGTCLIIVRVTLRLNGRCYRHAGAREHRHARLTADPNLRRRRDNGRQKSEQQAALPAATPEVFRGS